MRIWRYALTLSLRTPRFLRAPRFLLGVKSTYQLSPKGFIRLAVGFNPGAPGAALPIGSQINLPIQPALRQAQEPGLYSFSRGF